MYPGEFAVIKSKEEAVGEAKRSVTLNEADVKRRTAFADMMGLQAAKSSLLLSLLKLVSHLGRGWGSTGISCVAAFKKNAG